MVFEVVVIGGGPAGVTAALRARELGATVALVERGNMGGTCTNDGCVPTRVLARAARLVRDAEQFADYGLAGSPPEVNFARLLNRTQRIVYEVQETKQLREQLETAGASVMDGAGGARFVDTHTLALGDGSRVSGVKFVVCTGGHARRMGCWHARRTTRQPGAGLPYLHRDNRPRRQATRPPTRPDLRLAPLAHPGTPHRHRVGTQRPRLTAALQRVSTPAPQACQPGRVTSPALAPTNPLRKQFFRICQDPIAFGLRPLRRGLPIRYFRESGNPLPREGAS
jgi:hypothetical protein